MTDQGYGMAYDTAKWNKNAITEFFNEFLNESVLLKEKYEDYCDDNKLDPDAGFDENFADDYENETYLWDGFEGLITDVINDIEFNNETVFRDEDCCIYVPAYIPLDEKDKAKRPTRKDIERILKTYVGPFLQKPQKIEWLEINA